MRLLALTGVVLAVALVGAGKAQALDLATSQALRQLSATELKALIADIDAQGLQTNGTTNVKTGVSRMQMASGRLAALSTIGKISLVASGSVVVWQIADSLGAGGYVYKKITGSTYGGSVSWGGTPGWKYYANGISPGNFPAIPSDSWALHQEYDGTNPPAGYNPVSGWFDSSWATMAASITGSTTITNNGSYACGNVGECFMKYRTAAQMAATVTIQPSTAGEYASPPAGAVTYSGGTNDTSALTDLELEAALDEIDANNGGGTGTAVEQDTAVAILTELDPTWDDMTLLQPQPNETYTAYITRLQNAGWLGTATSTQLASVNEAYGPSAVARIIVTRAGTTTVYDPLGWPGVAPTIDTSTNITIRYNPNTASEAPTTPTSTPVTPPATTVPSAPGFDFSPITDIDWGCKFPFGFICYAQDITDLFNVTPDAPSFSFDLPDVPNPAGGEFVIGTYGPVDLNVMDDYMELWRDILSAVMWIGAVYLLAVRLLGFKAGGDPGEAIDDVM